MVQGSNPSGGRDFLHPSQPGAHPASNTIRTGSFPGHAIDHPFPSSTEVKERMGLYLYSPFGPSWPVLGCDSNQSLLK